MSLGACADQAEEPTLAPFRGQWRLLEGPIPLAVADDGEYDVSEVFVGGRLYERNFANRGDVLVEYETGRDSIEIHGRPFDAAFDRAEADQALERLGLWISDTDVATPDRAADDGDCTVLWHEGCGVRVIHEGSTQKVRSGMDLRVVLPADYRGRITVATEDLIEDADYQNRGNVCIWGLPGSASVALGSGQALVTMADTLQSAPSCAPADVAACDAQGWANGCRCTSDDQTFGQLSIQSTHPADIAVQTVPSVWSRFDIAVELPQNANSVPCSAQIDLAGADLAAAENPWTAAGETAPPPGAIDDGGYAMTIRSKGCRAVSFVEDPDAFVQGGEGMIDAQRGDLKICDGCVLNTSCDDFLENGLRLQ